MFGSELFPRGERAVEEFRLQVAKEKELNLPTAPNLQNISTRVFFFLVYYLITSIF
jgi:hypothetical protein